MRHPEPWYMALAAELGHPGYVDLAEIRQAEARESRELAASVTWHRSPVGLYWTVQYDARFTILREHGKRTWEIEVWPLTPALAEQAPRRIQPGIPTLADAKNLALNMPCFRCGLGSPLVLMTPCLPARPSLAADRWKCMDAQTCEAERYRLTDRGSGPRIELPVLDCPHCQGHHYEQAGIENCAADRATERELENSEPGTASLAGLLFPDGCDSCGLAAPHRHTNLVWDETWGLVPGPDDAVDQLS